MYGSPVGVGAALNAPAMTQSYYGGMCSRQGQGGGAAGGSSQNSSLLQLHAGAVGGGACGGSFAESGGSEANSHHKSMWAINPLYASNSGELFFCFVQSFVSEMAAMARLSTDFSNFHYNV